MTPKTYAYKHDAKKAALRSGLEVDAFTIIQNDEGRWTWLPIDPPLLRLQKEAEVEAADSSTPKTRKAKKTKKSRKAKATKKARVTWKDRLEAIKVRKGDVVDKDFIRQHLGDMDDKKARKFARQLRAMIN